MHWKIEPTGCCERKGFIQIRYSFFLDKDDYGFEKHYIDIPIIPKDFNYNRKDEEIDIDIKKLPTEKRLNPFHNHFCYFPHDVSNETIINEGNRILQEVYNQWCENKRPSIKNLPLIENQNTKSLCEIRVSEIKQWQQ